MATFLHIFLHCKVIYAWVFIDKIESSPQVIQEMSRLSSTFFLLLAEEKGEANRTFPVVGSTSGQNNFYSDIKLLLWGQGLVFKGFRPAISNNYENSFCTVDEFLLQFFVFWHIQ